MSPTSDTRSPAQKREDAYFLGQITVPVEQIVPASTWSVTADSAAATLQSIERAAPGAGFRLVVTGLHVSYGAAVAGILARILRGTTPTEVERYRVHDYLALEFATPLVLPENERAVLEAGAGPAGVVSTATLRGYTVAA